LAAENAALNGWRICDGTTGGRLARSVLRGHGPYDLVFANILARPLCLMARDLA